MVRPLMGAVGLRLLQSVSGRRSTVPPCGTVAATLIYVEAVGARAARKNL